MKTFKQYMKNKNAMNEAKSSEFDEIINIIHDDWKGARIIKFLYERKGLKLFEARGYFSDKIFYAYDGKELYEITTLPKLFELLTGKKPKIIYHEDKISEKKFDEIIDMIYDDWYKKSYIIKFLGERKGIKLFETRNRFSDKMFYAYDGKELYRVTTLSKLFELLTGKKPKIIYRKK